VGISPEGVRDVPTVGAAGSLLPAKIEGVVHARLAPIVDHRGMLTEVIDFEDPFWDEPVVYSYCFSIRPGRIKGWGMHKLQADRYFVATGNVRVVLYDGREDSITFGELAQFHFTDEAPGLLRIPPGVWHGDQNWGDRDAILLNFPTRPYNRADPDKYRLDPGSDAIPFDWALRDG
jgi:dTDP-4-dehydrorhamnose 3,5-epimerase